MAEMLAALARMHAPTLVSAPVLAALAVGLVTHALPPTATGAARDAFTRVPSLAQAALVVIALALFETMSLTNHPFIYFQF
ncbi:MAG: hypothetical protein HYZ27_10420 [Deltaproteobacteria bacterium]|nr:hypothetical protein [Deltaproteobacteria bacterium]